MCGGVAAEAPNNRLVRHEVVCVSVMPIEGHHLLFCQQYPTSTCVTGDGGVRSYWDKGASSCGMVTGACAAVTTASTEVVGSEDRMGRSTQVHGRKRREVRQAEGAVTLGPKGKGSGTGVQASPVAEDAPPA